MNENLYRILSLEKLDMFRRAFSDLQVIIVDEISMVGADKIYDMSRRVCEIVISEDLYGNKGTCFVGDPMQVNDAQFKFHQNSFTFLVFEFQLPPCSGRHTFKEPVNMQNKALWNSNESIWNSFDSVVLKVNHRQGEGNPWTNCLNRIRKGKVTDEDKAILESRRVKNFPDKNFEEAIHVFGTNAEANEINLKRLSALPGLPIKTEAKVECPKNYTPIITPHGTFKHSKFMKTLRLKVGAKVMLIHNVSLQDKLVNGVTGQVIEVLYHPHRKGEAKHVNAVIVKFNDPNVGEETRQTYQKMSPFIREQGGVPIFFASLTLNIPGRRPNSKHGANYTVTQIPLILGYAFTAHKLQGVTLKRGIDLYVNNTVWTRPGMVYVMLSRCEDIENVFLDDEFPLKKIRAEKASLLELKKLEEQDISIELAKKRFKIYYQNIYSLKNKLADLQNDIHPQQSDIICLVETWLQKGSKMQWPGKRFHQASMGKGNGVCMFIPEDQPYKLIGNYTNEKFQILSIMILDNLQLFLVYLSSTNCPYSNVVAEISKMLQRGSKPFVIGDFNFYPNKINTLTTYFEQIGLKQIVNEPTHTRGNTIDHCYVPECLVKGTKIKFQFTYYSDHASFAIQFPDKMK